MTYGKLIELQKSGILNIKTLEDDTFEFGGKVITRSELDTVVRNLGWVEHKLKSEEIIKKTNKFINGLKKHLNKDFDNIDFEFHNIASQTYDKTFDRIVVTISAMRKITIIYGMPGNPAAYTIYEHGKAVCIGKCRNLSEVAKFINN